MPGPQLCRRCPFSSSFAEGVLALPRGVEDAAPYGGNPWTFPLPQALTAARGLAANNWINQKETACFRRSLYFLPFYRAV